MPWLDYSYLLECGTLHPTRGENIVRIAHQGGPYKSVHANTIHFVETSDWIYLKLVKNESGEYYIELI